MRHSFETCFRVLVAAFGFWCLNIEAWGTASSELLHRVALIHPPLHLNC